MSADKTKPFPGDEWAPVDAEVVTQQGQVLEQMLRDAGLAPEAVQGLANFGEMVMALIARNQRLEATVERQGEVIAAMAKEHMQIRSAVSTLSSDVGAVTKAFRSGSTQPRGLPRVPTPPPTQPVPTQKPKDPTPVPEHLKVKPDINVSFDDELIPGSGEFKIAFDSPVSEPLSIQIDGARAVVKGANKMLAPSAQVMLEAGGPVEIIPGKARVIKLRVTSLSDELDHSDIKIDGIVIIGKATPTNPDGKYLPVEFKKMHEVEVKPQPCKETITIQHSQDPDNESQVEYPIEIPGVAIWDDVSLQYEPSVPFRFTASPDEIGKEWQITRPYRARRNGIVFPLEVTVKVFSFGPKAPQTPA